uniref:Secreted protein n=1 Tax=Globodera pallida TaxID=36090 RepID=A0A183BMP1_GLOPA
MREFIWAAHLLLLGLLNIFSSGFVDAAGNAQNASSSSKSVDSSVKKGSLADLIAMERIKEQENSSVVKETLAELIAMERIKEQENSSVVKGTLAELIAMEQIDDKEFDEFVQELRENEHLIRAVFPPQQSFKQVQTQKEEKGMLHTIFKILGEKKEDKKTALEQKYRKLKGIKQNDPALSQIMEKLLMYTENIKSERILKPELKEYLYFTIQFVAKRQRIPFSDIVPFKQMDKKRSLAKLVKLFLEEKTQKIGKDTQNKILEAFHELTEQNAPIEAPEGKTKSECAVCLGNFETGDKVRPLPPCEVSVCCGAWINRIPGPELFGAGIPGSGAFVAQNPELLWPEFRIPGAKTTGLKS